MNVVGKVGSLISQGVYSVATPFHPFGGAVDVIAVQQQDGTYRSTPWYVRFGKFQGVLKGAEKIVRISVNGVEADFHMYLDNSGEAYFVREVVSVKGVEPSGGLKESGSLEITRGDSVINEESFSDPGAIQLADEITSSVANTIERTESDGERRFYEFQDEQSSCEGSVELPEYGSNPYESLEENFGESQGLNSEVVLISVDGHILTAPISESEGNNDNVQLNHTPQFHLGPGEGTDFCEGNGEFNTGEDTWAANYISELDASSTNDASENVCNISKDINASEHQLEVCEGEGEHACQPQESRSISSREGDIKRKEIFKSCLELSELATQVGNADSQEISSPEGVQEEAEDLQENSACSVPANGATEDEGRDNDGSCFPTSCAPGSIASPDICVEPESMEKMALGMEPFDSGSTSVNSINNDLELKDEKFGMAPAFERTQSTPPRYLPEDDSRQGEIMEPQTTASSEGIQSCSRYEISLCGSKLRTGMGLSAAAEAFDSQRVSEEDFKLSAASIIKNENLIIRFRDIYLPWDKAAPLVLGMVAFGLELPVDPKDAISVEQDVTSKPNDENSGIATPPSGRKWRLWPIPFRRVKTLEHTSSNSSNDEVFVDSESGSQNPNVEPAPASRGGNESPHKQLIRTNIPTSEQIASLNLNEGQNLITFSFSTRVLGTQQVDAHIYLWKWNARIVISDVDGTITKSDVLGQFMPLVGKDWTQSGVTRLFSAIKENGYQLLFLSARAIVQAYLTRSFLLNVKQDGKTLPNGPIVISPDGLFPSLYREVIRRAPHEFKIACLEDIRALFPSDYNPFYAGFGNRDTDELSYRKIGIPKGKIFIINPKGEVAISHRIDVRSYTSLHTLVNDMFPPTSLVEQEDFNSWNYWRMPLPDIDC